MQYSFNVDKQIVYWVTRLSVTWFTVGHDKPIMGVRNTSISVDSL